MNTTNTQALPAPPSLMTSLMAGFDAIANHLSLVIFPLALDLFFWFGPRLKITGMVKAVSGRLLYLPGLETPETREMLRVSREFWNVFAERFSLFSALRSYPVGLPSLLSAQLVEKTPAGQPGALEITALLPAAAIWLGLSLIGLILGTLYFQCVAHAAVGGEVNFGLALRRWPYAALQVLLLALFWAALALTLGVIGFCLVSVAALGGLFAGQVGLFVFAGLALWLFFPLIFSVHGVFINQRPMWRSVMDGIRLTRLTLPGTSLLVMVLVLLGEGLDVLWRIPAENSWLMILGIAGHSFIATGILAASFVYYRDATRWIQRLLQQRLLASTR